MDIYSKCKYILWLCREEIISHHLLHTKGIITPVLHEFPNNIFSNFYLLERIMRRSTRRIK